MTFDIELRPAGSGAACAAILADLPEWFGMPASNANYAKVAEEGPAYVIPANGEPCAIMLLRPHFDTALEIYLLGVRPGHHRNGIGRAMVDQARAVAAERGARYLTVKTLGPSANYEPYLRTLAFYRAMGFTPLEEFTEMWDPENPMLFLAMPVG